MSRASDSSWILRSRERRVSTLLAPTRRGRTAGVSRTPALDADGRRAVNLPLHVRMSAASSPSAPLGFGIIGVGMIADFHAQAIAHAQGGRLVGVATRNAANARAFAQKHQVAFATTSVEE